MLSDFVRFCWIQSDVVGVASGREETYDIIVKNECTRIKKISILTLGTKIRCKILLFICFLTAVRPPRFRALTG